jgi:hypothetical protein
MSDETRPAEAEEKEVGREGEEELADVVILMMLDDFIHASPHDKAK